MTREPIKTSSAIYDFANMIENSWTFDRMTPDERARWYDIIHGAVIAGAIKGCYSVRWEILNAIYSAFLAGLGYNGFTWREGGLKK